MTRILMVEDDDSIAIGLKYYFEKIGYEVVRACDAFTAKDLFRKEDFDLVIMDIGLPDADGFELTKHIRTDNELPIIFLTARDEEDDLIKAFEIGGDDYMTKPFSLKELEARVNRLLKRADKDGAKKVSKDIMLDTQRQIAFKNGAKLDLTSMEYKLLLYFMTNPKKPLTRDELIAYIWDTDEIVKGNNTISVYIKRLREKIEDDLIIPEYILTLRNVGYVWDQEVK